MELKRDPIEEHCREIERCNQRGGRMLSVVDLIEAGTLNVPLAAYLLAAIGRGASSMIGAMPGGAGKTTVMGALLNLVPPDVVLRPADGLASVASGLAHPDPRGCYICHEIGDGPYYAYLRDEPLRKFFELPSVGHLIAANLHADTMEQALDQVCGENRVPVNLFRRMNLVLFISVDRRSWQNVRRQIVAVWESDGVKPHRPIRIEDGVAGILGSSVLVQKTGLTRAITAVDSLRASGHRDIRPVRTWLMEHFLRQPDGR